MISALSSAASGMQDALVRVDVAAHNIANVDTAGFASLQVSSATMPEGGVAPVVTAAGSGLGAAVLPGGSGTDLPAELVTLDALR